MDIAELKRRFPDEESCINEFKIIKEKLGIICPKCGNIEHSWRACDLKHQCNKCGFRQSLRSGTLLQNSKLPFRYWIIAVHLIANSYKNISAREIQIRLNHKRYEPIWLMMKKINAIIEKEDYKKSPIELLMRCLSEVKHKRHL